MVLESSLLLVPVLLSSGRGGAAQTLPPIFSRIAISVGGLFSIRAFNAAPRFRSALAAKLDASATFDIASYAVPSFVALYIDIICSLAILACALLLVGDDASSIGLALSNALQLLVFVQWTLRQADEVSARSAA